jgi:hypothetical protein
MMPRISLAALIIAVGALARNQETLSTAETVVWVLIAGLNFGYLDYLLEKWSKAQP